MKSFNPTEQEMSQAEKIRRQYLSHEENKMEQLQKLDQQVKLPGKITASILGVLGALIMGSGMSMTMVTEVSVLGIVLGVIGMVIALAAYPVYQHITNRRKETYAQEILELTDAVISE